MNLRADLRGWLVLLVVLGLAACSPTDTAPSSLSKTSLPPAVPSIEETPVETRRTFGSLTLSGTRFAHPNKSFSLEPPDGWTTEVDETGASWLDPAGEGKIEVHVNTTGYQLGGQFMDNFVEAVEENYFGAFDGYRVLDRTLDNLGERKVIQTLNEDGIEYQVVSIYDQEKDVVYESEFWMSTSSIDGYMPAYEKIWRNMDVSSDSASASIEPYTIVYTFMDPAGLYTLDVPVSWHMDTYTQPDAEVNTFWTPDRLARIEIIKYDDGTEISKSLAGAFALDLLHQWYSEDAKIAEDKVQPDGRERLKWSSRNKSQSGISLFETRGTTFLMLTFVTDNSVDDIYLPVFDRLLQSYTVP